VGWDHSGTEHTTRDRLIAHLSIRPAGLFRLKGFVGHDAESAWEVHVVGPSVDIKPMPGARGTQIVGIGLEARLSRDEIADWWAQL
jgi:hypothetical protein